MKYILAILFTLVALTANADSGGVDDSDCIPSKHLTQKQGNYTKADLSSLSTLRPCGMILDSKTVISNLSMISTKDDLRYFKNYIEDATHEYQRIEDAMKDVTSISLIFEYLSYCVFVLMPFYLTAVMIKSTTSKENLRGVLVTLGLGLFGGLVFNISTVYTGMTLGTLGTLGYINYEQSDNDTFNDVLNSDLSNISTAYNESNTKLITAIKYDSIQNTVTNFHLKEVLGGRLDLDATLLGDEDDVNRPTEGEFRFYQKHCEKASGFAVTDKDFSFLVANFNYTNLPVSGNILSAGDTSEFNCSDHYGKLTKTVSITSNAVVSTDRFMLGLFEEEMAKDLNWLESLKASFDSLNGRANLVLEKTAEVASNNIDVIPSQLELALSAVKESKSSNTPIKKTKSWDSLVASQKTRMGNVYDNGDIEDMTVMQEMALNAIQGQYFKSATLFGYSPEEGEELDFISDKFGIGFYYLSPFVNETSKLALEIGCINTDGKFYPHRINFANYYNNVDLETPHHLTKRFGGESGAHCYKYVGDKLVAGANPEDLQTLRSEVRQRDKALSVWFDSIDAASIELIMDKPNLNDDILVDYLNTLDTTFQSTVDSYLVLTKVKQELMQIFNTVDDAFSVKYAMEEMIEDTSKPATYFSFGRFYDNVYQQDLDQIAQSKGLRFFDLKDYFTLSVQTFIDSENIRATEAQGVINTLFKPRCPVIDQYGNCEASIIQLLQVNYETMFSISESLTLYKLVIDGVDGACDLGSGGNTGGSLQMGAAKSNPYIMAICGLSGGLDTVNELIVAPAINVGWVLTFFNKVGLLIPSLADLFVFILGFVMIFIPILMIPILLNVEMLRNLMYQFSDDPKSFERLTDFDATINAVKTLIISSFALCFTGLVGIWLYTSGGFGGGIFDTLVSSDSDIEETTIKIIISLLLVVVVVALIAVKFIPSILSNIYDQIMQYMKVQASKMSESSNAFSGFMVGYFTTRAFDQANKVQSKSLGASKNSLKNKATKFKENLNAKSSPNNNEKVNVDIVDKDHSKEKEVTKSSNQTSKKKPMKTYEFEGDIVKMDKDELKKYEEDIIKSIHSSENPKK
jgi:hypothetical protein